MSRRENIILFIAVVMIAFSLINSHVFDSATMAAYYLYVIVASMLFIITGITVMKNNKLIIIANPLPIYLFIALGLFFFTQRLIMGDSLNIRHTFLLVNILILISFSLLYQTFQLHFSALCSAICIISGIEALICIMQGLKLMHTQNEFFPVTGTWVNPNVTAMFFVMAIPALLFTIFSGKPLKMKISSIILTLVCTSLFLLECRTAFVGAFMAVVIILNAQFGVSKKLRSRYSVFKLAVFASIFIAILIPLALSSYEMKKASADGRKLIWKISLNMIVEKPWMGYGYGRFEHDYNLFQAKYFANGSGTKMEVKNASFVQMAYNEYLENGVEGGIIGFIIFTSILISLLLKPSLFEDDKQGKMRSKPVLNDSDKSIKNCRNLIQTAAYAGIAAFAVMSIFNFTIQGIPIMILFLIYAAVRTTNSTPDIKPRLNEYKPGLNALQSLILCFKTKNILSSVLIIVGICICITHLTKATASIKNNDAQLLASEGNKQRPIKLFKDLESELNQNCIYLTNYGKTLFAQKNYPLALLMFSRARALTSDPDLYMLIGNCYYKMGKYNEAGKAYNMAGSIVPNRLTPRFALMKLYNHYGDTAQALAMANELIAQKPKVESERAVYYKKEAEAMIKLLGYKPKLSYVRNHNQ